MGPLDRLVARMKAPRRTVRLRLTLLYGSLFLISGAGLLTLNYALVDHATQGAVSYQGSNGLRGSIDNLPSGQVPARGDDNAPELTPAQSDEQVQLLRDRAIQQREDNMRELLTQSGITLAIMALVSVALGWLVAGRVLRRLRTITLAAQQISATDLHRRLALPGPKDELKELGDTFDDLLARLEASFQAHRQFVANASHELLTPLARQRVISQVAVADQDATVEALRKAHERVIQAGTEQQQLIEALLTLARGQAGFETREPFDLATLAEQSVASHYQEGERHNLTLRTRLDAAPTAGDPRLAERLVTNLLENALRHNQVDGWVEIVTGVEDGLPFVRVTNAGPEVPSSALERLLLPFERMQSSRTNGTNGHGLGLSIVKAIVDAHHATLTAKPRPGGGLSISVAFPAIDATHPASTAWPRTVRVAT
ncbi:MAG: HAMP domain-containing protein [Micromonosporaceae bacterium]|nr:HAMP domain-containing protein [Micromonosporaceae bacterium]